ncbi:MAG: inositol monophosphatase [Beijerinckiaceae bacterium]|jgi:myo-inositol-1(or 4)-monophosphatase|nr:inositol monophosphatase [Beijerinckiaceae bacterium]
MSSLRPDDMSARFQALAGIAMELGHLANRYFADQASLGTRMKGFQDFLTEADGAVEALFRRRIAESFPHDAVMGEEMGGGNADRLWIIDPIDGTANFARGDRQWCISIGFVVDGVPELGVIHSPALGETFLARRGHGATMNGRPIKVAATADIRQSTVEFGWSPRLPAAPYVAAVGRLLDAGANVKRSASGALGLAHVAIGRTDAYGELHINSWDVAAGLVIAAEAGARINDFCSGDWVASGNPILVVTPTLWDAVSEACAIVSKPAD